MSADHYAELRPPPAAHALLRCVWSFTMAGPPRPVRIVPDGCVDVIWYRETGRLLVAGPDTHAQVGTSEPSTLIGVRFAPGASSAVLGLPAAELRDARVDLADLWQPATVRRLAERLAACPAVPGAQQLLVQRMLSGGTASDPLVAAVRELAGRPMPVSWIAATLGLSERQLHRHCLAAFGYGPKVLHRVLRFDRAVRLARRGEPFAALAHRCGFADQAHLSREVKALSGVPLGELVPPDERTAGQPSRP